eukprot:gene1537-1794_t
MSFRNSLFMRSVVTFVTPVVIGVGVTWALMRDENKDVDEFKSQQPRVYRNNHENNQEIFRLIKESTKGDKLVYFQKDEELKQEQQAKQQQQQKTTPAVATSPVDNKK